MAYTSFDVAIINQALQTIGTRTTVTTTEMNALTSNEAIQSNLIYADFRDRLLRMAPWNCGMKTQNLIWITSTPGTPENTSPGTAFWQPGQPRPPYAYEYWYPDDCLRACWIIPAQQTGFANGVPITTAVTGGAPAFWQGEPVKFVVAADQFRAASGAYTIIAGGTGYAVNDTVILGTDTLNQNFNANQVPAGIIKVIVTGVAGGVVTSVSAADWATVQQNGCLFGVPTYNLVAVQTSGLGTGLSLSIAAVGATQFDYPVILTNQEFATLAYVKQVTDPNAMDQSFKQAWISVLGAGLVMALTGDKGLANMKVALANKAIEEARKNDGNEALTINDVTPDFIRVRGINWSEYYTGPYAFFDFGAYWPTY